MRTSLKFLLLGFIALISACCNDDEELAIASISKKPIQFYGDVITLTPESKTTQGFFLANDSIGIFMIPGGSELNSTNILDGVNNFLYKASSIGAVPRFVPASTDTIFFPTSQTPSFIAYSPGIASIASDFLLPVNLSNQPSVVALLKLDLLYSNNAVNQENISVQLSFKHMYSYLNFEIDAGAGISAADLQGMTITIKNVSTTADFNLATGSFENMGAQTDSILVPGQYYPTNQAAFFECLSLPGANGSNSQIVFKLANNKTFVYNIPATQVFSSGYIYTYLMTLAESKLIVDGLIIGWQAGTLPNGGVITVQ